MRYYLFIAMLLSQISGQCFAKNPTYRVASQSGEFFVWNGLDVGWERVTTNSVYRENTVFQSMGGSRIDLRQTKETIQGTAKNVFVESKGRVIFRLNDEVVRKLQISSNFVSKLDTGIKEEEKEEKLVIMSAWKKIASLMKPTSQEKGGDSAKVGAGKVMKQSLSVEDIGERIVFTYPAKGGIFVPDSLPMFVPIIWKNVANEAGCYEVFVKSVDSTGFNRVGVVKEPRIDVKLDKQGAYVIRIQCAANSARSEELFFNVLLPDAKEWKKPVTAKKQKTPLEKAADLKIKKESNKPNTFAPVPDAKTVPVSGAN